MVVTAFLVGGLPAKELATAVAAGAAAGVQTGDLSFVSLVVSGGTGVAPAGVSHGGAASLRLIRIGCW